jgi:hypothetical protein
MYEVVAFRAYSAVEGTLTKAMRRYAGARIEKGAKDMNVSPSPNDLGRRVQSPPSDRPAPTKSKVRSRVTWLAIGAGALGVILVAILVFAQRTQRTAPSVAPSIAGTWVGTGTVTNGGQSQLFAVYLDLTTGANGRITGAGDACVVGFTDHFTITGAPGSSTGSYTMQWTKTDPTGTTHTLNAVVHVSGSQMTLSGSDASTSPPTTNSAMLMPGSMSDYSAKCSSLPTPAPSS